MKQKPLFESAQNRYTLDSDYATSQYNQTNGGLQVNFLSPTPSKSRITHFESIPPSQKKHKHQKSSIQMNYKQNIFDHYQQGNNQNAGVHQSTINIRISNPTETFFNSSTKIIDHSSSNMNSSKNLIASDKIKNTELHKSGTEPLISSTKQCQGYSITTNLVKEQRNFKKEKLQYRPSDKNKTMSYLNVSNTNQPQKKLMASRVISESRITLKDYMFMANTSSKKAAENKRSQIEQSRKVMRTQPSMQPSQKPNIILSRIRDRYHEQKYHISNDEMGEVLNESIKDQILNLNGKIKIIQHWMQKRKKVKSQELILLYSIRNDLQSYNKKFDESIAKLVTDDNQLYVNAIYTHSKQESSPPISEKSQIFELSQI